MALTQIDHYDVIYSANSFMPRIGLKKDRAYVGQLVFHPDGATLPPDGGDPAVPSLHYHLADFHNALTLLRTGTTVWLVYNGSGGGFENGLQTDAQAVGAGMQAAAGALTA